MNRNEIIIFSRDLKLSMGGLEIFNANMLEQMKEKNIKFHHVTSSPPFNANKYLDYISRIKRTITLHKKIKKPILVQYGSFIDILSTLIIHATCCKPYVICHVGSAWLHIRLHPLRKLTEYTLKNCCNKIFYIADLQKKMIKLPPHSKKCPTIINKTFSTDGKKQNRRGFLYLGRISESKGIFDLINAHKSLPKNIREKNKLYIYGPAEKDDLEKLTDEIKHDSSIEYKGVVSNEKLKKDIYYRHKILVSPSLYDAFPLNVLEATACGLIPIVSNVSEAANLINHNNLVCTPHKPEELRRKMTWSLEHTDHIQPQIEIIKTKSRSYASGKLVNFLKTEIFECEKK
ncbi:glycosyltransferase family 4 protein [Thalassospira marina]|uniref:Glycosyl transferase family 1 domain-containing protein n=1 Tax=Thalassospira marina TaxID=2048283 RepID=A0A2N3KVF9_9PROT|nr:glycosyltransferase family 4 protein [Thalassospira marina]PKR54552.1 hypothetical protein COO20_07265 [Thalassospira marina]